MPSDDTITTEVYSFEAIFPLTNLEARLTSYAKGPFMADDLRQDLHLELLEETGAGVIFLGDREGLESASGSAKMTSGVDPSVSSTFDGLTARPLLR